MALVSSQAIFDMGDVQRGLEYSQRGTEQALTAHGLECAVAGYFCTGLGNLQSRNLTEAEKAFEASLKLLADHLSEFKEDLSSWSTERAGLAIAQFFGGRVEAISDMENRWPTRPLGDDYTVAFLAHALGEGYTQLCDFERAKQNLDSALDYYRRNGMRPYVARVLKSSADLHQAQGRVAEAERDLAAGRLMEELSLPPVRLPSDLQLDADEPEPAGPADR